YTNSDIANGNYFLTGGAVRYRFSNRFTLSTDVTRQHDDNQIGYAFFREPGGEPVIGYRKNTEVTAVLTGIYNFTPRMNLNLRGRHYWNKVNYRSFFTVSATGDHIPRTGPAPDQDYNFNLFNVDAFITWDFRLGSRLIFGWKNWLADSYGTDISHRTFGENFSHVFGLNHGNEFTLKLIYFIDYNQLARSSR
ncbi:MAG TPA: DUF5916 domain-containing protein, partial [Flavisolibacter sp.]